MSASPRPWTVSRRFIIEDIYEHVIQDAEGNLVIKLADTGITTDNVHLILEAVNNH